MAEIVLAVVGPAIELGKYIAEPMKRQINYLCCFTNNVQNLREEVKKLEEKREELQERVRRDQNNNQAILSRAKSWREKANKELLQVRSEIDSEIENIKSGCLAVKSRYSLSKKVKKKTEALKELRDACPKSDEPISRPPPPVASVSNIPLGAMPYEFESRKKNEEDILMALKDSSVHIVGIWGMGGVGKTTMADRVIRKVREEKLFDEIVELTVSQHVDKLRIQGVMAGQLGLELVGENSDLSSRAKQLRDRLKGRRILLFLDDVWECLDLEELMALEIPRQRGLEGCRVLLTSRSGDVLDGMGAARFEIQTLSEDEARSLFKDKTGVDDPNLLPLAEEIVRECKGLPVALISVAAALKVRKNTIQSWKVALRKLKNPNPKYLPKYLQKVYNPLKLSYDYLESQHNKTIFLLCCLFREDYNISLKYLALYAMGLRVFEDIRTLDEVSDEIWSSIETLRKHSLLLEGEYKDHVRMHDVVRDVAIFIATDEGRIKCGDCTWASPYVGERIEFPVGSNLNLLMFDGYADKECQIDDSLLRGKINLNVVSIERWSLRSLPLTIEFPRNLRTLILHACWSLESVCIVSEFVNLEVLICHYCHELKELPMKIMRLKCLKLLEISDCRALLQIAAGVISSLDKLEELKIVRSFKKWEGEKNGGGGNARLSELESLSNLKFLEIEIEDYNLAAEHISLPPKIVKYDITIGGGFEITVGEIDLDHTSDEKLSVQKKLCVHLPREITLGNWIHECVKSAECLYLSGDGSKSLNLGSAHQNIRSLYFEDCSLTSSSVLGRSCGVTTNVFLLLEYLKLKKLPNLEEIGHIDGPLLNVSSSSSDNISFKNIRELELEDLPELKRLWKGGPYQDRVVSLVFSNFSSITVCNCKSLPNLLSLSTTTDVCFPQLERLEINQCDMMEQVFLWSEEENEKDIGQGSRRAIRFPKLKMLRLGGLPRLKTLCQGIETIEFPLLTEMNMWGCPQLKSLATSSGGINVAIDDDNDGDYDDDDGDGGDFSYLLCKTKVSFGNLRELYLGEIFCRKAFHPQIPFTELEILKIEYCGNITSLFSFSIAQNLTSLQCLAIGGCAKMEKVIEGNDEISRIRLFPNMKELRLNDLPELKIFCDRRCYLELPKVEDFHIEHCPSFSLGSELTTPNLKSLSIRDIVNTNGFLLDALQIEKLVISNCEMMEHIVTLSSGVESVKFPKLRTVRLISLPRLTSFCSGSGNIEFPLLTLVKIVKCPNLKSLASASDRGIENDKVVFGKLEELTICYSLPIWCDTTAVNFITALVDVQIKNCDEIRSLFSFPIACNLINLKRLTIRSCKEMVKVIEGEEEYSSNESTTILFPHLEVLSLYDLCELTIFSELRRALKLPSLIRVNIFRCPKLERFSLGSTTAPQLTKVIGYQLDDLLQPLYSLRQESKRNATDQEEKEECEIEGEECETEQEQE